MALIVKNVAEYFDTLPARFIPKAARGVKATFQFELGGDEGGTWHVRVADGEMQVCSGSCDTPTATLKMNAADYVRMVNGELNGTMAFMKGMLKVTGNVIMAQKMSSIFPPNK
jgi:putative sterol carrier protein